VLTLLLAAAAAAGVPVLNEVCYDPAGADAGGEYVEFYHGGPDTISLAGARLEFANGAEGVVWRAQWTGGPGARIAPGEFFLLADEGWQGAAPADAVADLALQNGPDAVRLVLPGGAIDLLGYGALAEPQLSEGSPAPNATAGKVLARRPDGRDTDDNATDFVVADPSPGAANFPGIDLRLLKVTVEPPSSPVPGEEVAVSVRIANRGLDVLRDAAARIEVGAATGVAPVPPLAAAAETTVTVRLSPQEIGRLDTAVEITWSQTQTPWRRSLGAFQVGPAWCCLNEVMAAPPGGGEWVEILNLDDGPRSLATLALRDEDGAWRGLPDVVLAPGACAVVAQDLTGFRSWWDASVQSGAPLGCDDGLYPEARVVAANDGWPSLNDSPPASRAFADRVYLGDGDGVVLDHVTLAVGEAPQRRSWERVAVTWRGPLAAGWRPATAPAGSTPTCANSVAFAGATGGGLEARPNPFSRGEAAGATHLRFEVGQGSLGWQLRVFDLWGRTVRDLGGDDLGEGPRDVVWDGCDDGGRPVAAGGYVAALRLLGPGGSVVAGGRRLVVLREGAP
jgi:hypothetical protein